MSTIRLRPRSTTSRRTSYISIQSENLARQRFGRQGRSRRFLRSMDLSLTRERLLLWMLPGIYYRGSSYRLRDLKPIGVVYYLFLLFLQRPIYRRGFRYVDMIVAPSINLARALDADAGRIPVTQVYNGMVFPPAPPFRRTRNVLFVGRLEAVKGVDILLRAVALAREQVHGLSVTITGDGEDRSRLERMSSDLGLDRNRSISRLAYSGRGC